MSKIEMLRLLINQRLTAAAEEIFGVFGRTIAEYEDEICRSKLEIDRQRRLLDLSRTPQVCVQLDGSAETGLDWSSGLDLDQDQDQDQVEHPHIKEEEEQEKWSPPPPPLTEHNSFSSSLRGVTRDKRENDHVTSSPSERRRKLRTLEDPEAPQLPGTSLQPSCSDPDEDLAEASDPASGDGSVDLEPPPPSEAVDQYICSVCGRAFAQRNHWAKHVQVHGRTQDKDRSFTCDICGKRLTRFDGYQKHLRVHTGEKPYCCSECGRRFSDNSNYKRHVRTHRAHGPCRAEAQQQSPRTLQS